MEPRKPSSTNPKTFPTLALLTRTAKDDCLFSLAAQPRSMLAFYIFYLMIYKFSLPVNDNGPRCGESLSFTMQGTPTTGR